MAQASSSRKCPLPRLLRCFCNCTELTYDQVAHIAKLSVPELVSHPRGLLMLKAFLRLDTTSTPPIVYKDVEHAEVCEQVLAGNKGLADEDILDELFERCPTLADERRLEAITSDGDAAALREYCHEMSRKLAQTIELDDRWADFQRELRRKLGG